MARLRATSFGPGAGPAPGVGVGAGRLLLPPVMRAAPAARFLLRRRPGSGQAMGP